MTKEEAIRKSLWQVTIGASFRRANIYTENVPYSIRKDFRKDLEDKIRELEERYLEVVLENSHIENIRNFKSSLEARWRHILKNGSISYGVIQKCINLHLKLLWCLGKIPEPPHCPLDNIIMRKLQFKDRVKWTKISDIESYETIISKLREKAGNEGLSLAQWELREYQP